MDRDDWYENRVLWRAGQHSLVGSECSIFSELPQEQRESVLAKANAGGRPLLLFGGPSEPWTLLTTRSVASYYDSRLHLLELDRVTEVMAVGGADENIKHSANTVRLASADGDVDVWSPPGPTLFALVSVLRMLSKLRARPTT